MGVKSTIELTREQAIDRAIDIYTKAHYRTFYALYSLLDDDDLEEVLEQLNDKANDGEGFENYSIQTSTKGDAE